MTTNLDISTFNATILADMINAADNAIAQVRFTSIINRDETKEKINIKDVYQVVVRLIVKNNNSRPYAITIYNQKRDKDELTPGKLLSGLVHYLDMYRQGNTLYGTIFDAVDEMCKNKVLGDSFVTTGNTLCVTLYCKDCIELIERVVDIKNIEKLTEKIRQCIRRNFW